MSFVLRMAARELRASWRRLLFFFICVAVLSLIHISEPTRH